MRGPELYEQIQLWTVKQTLLWTSSFAGPRTPVVPLHRGKSSRFGAYLFTHSPWRLCTTFWFLHRFSHLEACMCGHICTNTHTHTHTGTYPVDFSCCKPVKYRDAAKCFWISELQPTSFSRLSPSAVSLSLSLTLCVYLLPLLRKPALVHTCDYAFWNPPICSCSSFYF